MIDQETLNDMKHMDLAPMPEADEAGFTAHFAAYEAKRRANAQLLSELTQLGVPPEFAPAMISTFFEGLVAVGVINKLQLLMIKAGWEERFYNQLVKMRADVQDAIDQAEARAKLAVPGGRGNKKLIVPGA